MFHMGDRTRVSQDAPLLVPLKEYLADAPITKQVTAINRFEFTIFYQNAQLLATRRIADLVASEGLQAVNDALTTSVIFQLHNLKTEVQGFKKRNRIDRDRAIVRYTFDHDRFQCTFSLFDDRFTIVRQDSEFDNFYEWYRRIMPQAVPIESTIRRVIEKEANQSLEVVQSQFDFRVNFGDFETRASVIGSPRRRNVDVLKALIPSLPDAQGDMREISDQNFYRLDLTLSRLEKFLNGKTRNAWYYLEAPFNENGRYLVLQAQLRNSSTELPGTDIRRPADVLEFDRDFGDDYRTAINEFLRDRALEGFARKLLEAWDFKTPRSF